MVLFSRKEQKMHQELHTNLLGIKYLQTVHKIITTRLENNLDKNQPREQPGFRSKYSTTDHIHAINHRNRSAAKNSGRQGGIRQSPGYLQKQP